MQEDVIQRVREVLDKTKLTQREVAERIGINHNTFATQLKKATKKNDATLLRAISNELGISYDWLLDGLGTMTDGAESTNKLIPLLPITASGGSLDLYSKGIEIKDCEYIPSPLSDVEFAIVVNGDSMMPKYPSGALLYVKAVKGSFIEWGKTYVIDTIDGFVVKDVEEGGNNNMIKCVSKNDKYKPYEVPKNEILGMYKILCYLVME